MSVDTSLPDPATIAVFVICSVKTRDLRLTKKWQWFCFVGHVSLLQHELLELCIPIWYSHCKGKYAVMVFLAFGRKKARETRA